MVRFTSPEVTLAKFTVIDIVEGVRGLIRYRLANPVTEEISFVEEKVKFHQPKASSTIEAGSRQ